MNNTLIGPVPDRRFPPARAYFNDSKKAAHKTERLIHHSKHRTYLILGLISVILAAAGWLLKLDLEWQNNVLRASEIAYQQQLRLKHLNPQLHWLLGNEKPDLEPAPDTYSLPNIRRELKVLQSHHLTLKNLLSHRPSLLYDSLHTLPGELMTANSDLDDKISDFYQYVTELLDRPLALTTYEGAPQDTLATEYYRPLMDSAIRLEKLLFSTSLLLNQQISLIYASLLVLIIAGIWLVWYFLLYPLTNHLTRSYQKIHQISSNLFHQSRHDALTGLPNRMGFDEQFESPSELAHVTPDIALMLIDVDNFKSINDNLGHRTGDEVLIRVADFLSRLPDGDAFRISGDEFAFLARIPERAQVCTTAETILAGIKNLYSGADRRLSTSVTIGIAWGELAGDNPHDKFSAADIALYKAKDTGRNRYRMFDSVSNKSILETLELESAFMEAIEKQQFVVHYQPIVDALIDRTIGLEALIRWQHPQKGLLLPSEWLHLADRSGSDHLIAQTVLNDVMHNYHEWQEKGIDVGVININLPESVLTTEKIDTLIQPIQEACGSESDRCWLGIEISENVLLDRALETTRQKIEKLQSMGITISLDDFGTGYSNLCHLRQIPFDVIKLDRSFTQKILDDPGMLTIVRALVDITKGLAKRLVVEGVEAPEIRDALRALGADHFQGFLYAKPMPAHQIESYLLGQYVS